MKASNKKYFKSTKSKKQVSRCEPPILFEDLIIAIFEKEGFNFINWKNNCKNLFINEENFSHINPSRKSLDNLNKGLEIFSKLGKIDLAQSMIIQNNIILGIEAAEGTDELIKRCNKYKKKGDKGILLKLSKYNQDSNIDNPVIGLKKVIKLKVRGCLR